jgi:pimeloyl-ACP methyl ester carboxylesterase
MVPYLENIFQLPWAKSKKRRNFAFLTDRKVKVISHSISRFYWIMSNTDWIYWESRLGSIQQTVLVLWGDHDTLFGEKEIQRFSKIMPNAELRTIVGGGHAMTREAPGAIVREFRTL